jgi:insertion element IS1 protein InsB
MITEVRHYHCCQSINIVLNGHSTQGKQRYKCKDCGVTRVLNPKPSMTPESVAALDHSNSQRLSYRAHLQGQSWNGIQSSEKKIAALPAFKTTVLPAQADDVLEVDEIFTFVAVKVFQIRIWIVQCRRTRQILAFFLGDGSMESCKALWRKLPYDYQRCLSFSDFWRA